MSLVTILAPIHLAVIYWYGLPLGRISLMVGVAAALVAVVVGTLYGSLSGYLGGKIDSLMMRLLEILNSFPFMFFVILLVTFFGQNILLIFVAIGMVSWLDMARIVRGQTLSLKRKEFIEAALVGGFQPAILSCAILCRMSLGSLWYTPLYWYQV